MTTNERIIEAVLTEVDSVGRPRLAHESLPLTTALVALYEAVQIAGANYWRIGDDARAWHNDVEHVEHVRVALNTVTALLSEKGLTDE